MNLTIGYLYGDLMNTYGDDGNIIALKKRAEWRGIKVKVLNISNDKRLTAGEVDIFFFGGGQDQAQTLVCRFLKKNAKVIKDEVEKGVPLLSVCGGYQLLGEYYKPHQGPKLEGIGLFPAYTVAGNKRMIGNIVIKLSTGYRLQSTAEDGRQKSEDLLVGFENHSGKTYLKKDAQPLGKVIKGSGNNGEDKTEGCVYKNAIGCYMHGSLLPKNPQLTDWLLKKALEVKYKKVIDLKPLDDILENKAHIFAISKFS